MRVGNHLWSLAAILVAEGIFAFAGALSLYEYTLLALGAIGALSINLGMWDE